MRKLIIALTVVAQPAMADYFVVSIPSDRMTTMVAYEGVPRPVDASADNGHDWLVIRDNDKYVHQYLDNADDVVQLSAAKYKSLKKTCGVIAQSCVQTILAETGHD